jgi:hypothetical protein
MAKIVIEKPELHETKTVDQQGRVYLGRDLAGRDVEIVVEVVDDEPEE